MNIEKVLKEYKVKKSYVESILARIEQYKYMIDHPEMFGADYLAPTKELGTITAKGNGGSWIEHYLIEKELNEEKIKKWIQRDESRVFFAKLEIEQIEKALTSLTNPEKQVIEWKYFDNMIWKEITDQYNEQFRVDRPVTYETLKKKNKVAIDKITMILEPFYSGF